MGAPSLPCSLETSWAVCWIRGLTSSVSLKDHCHFLPDIQFLESHQFIYFYLVYCLSSKINLFSLTLGFPGGSEVKASACNAGDLGLIPGSGTFPWRRKWQPTPVFLPGESHGQRNLAGYSPRGRKESDTTEQLHFHS